MCGRGRVLFYLALAESLLQNQIFQGLQKMVAFKEARALVW